MRRFFLFLLLFVVGVAFTLARPAAQTAAPAKPQAAVGVQQPAAAPVVRPKLPMLASVDPALFRGLRYRLVGPSRGGRVTTVTGVPSQPHTFYMGVASGGVFRTTDSGATWAPITDGKVPLGSIGLDRGRRLEPEHHLPRHRLRRRAQQRLHRPRRLQDHRRRQDLDVRRPLQRRPDRRRPHPPDQSRHRLGGGCRRHLQAEHRARHLQDDRRRQDAGRRCCSSPTASARWTSSSSPATRTSSTPGCRASSASRGRSSAARARAASTRARRRRARSRRSRPACPASSSARATWRSPPRIRTASTRSSRRSRAAGSTARTTPARRGRW